MHENAIERIPNLVPIPTTSYPTPAKRPLNSKLNNSKIQQQFGIKPSDWQSSLCEMKKFRN